MHRCHPAKFWLREKDAVRCRLCPHFCLLREGEKGLCGVRQVIDGSLFTLNYGYPASIHPDPVEKKPLYHFLPGTKTLSIGTAGCNLSCDFCQNWDISTCRIMPENYVSPEEIVDLAERSGCASIAFTYNEPTVFAEYLMDISTLAAEKNIPCIMVSNGFISPAARKDVYRHIRAANIDLKAFSDDFYEDFTGGKLQPVLDTIAWCVKNNIHTEITTLLIPGRNDSSDEIKKISDHIHKSLHDDIALHYTAFFPAHRCSRIPAASQKSLTHAVKIAKKSGLHYIYNGNYPGINQNTYCHECGELVIERRGFDSLVIRDHVHELPIVWSV